MVCAQRSRLQQQEDAMQIVQAGTCGKRIVCTVQPHRPTTDHSSKMVLRPRLLHCLVQSGCGVLCTVPHMTSSTTLQLLRRGIKTLTTAVTFLEFSLEMLCRPGVFTVGAAHAMRLPLRRAAVCLRHTVFFLLQHWCCVTAS